MIPLYIPYFNRIDLLQIALESAVKADSVVDVKVINNSEGENLFVSGPEQLTPPVPLHYGPSQNWMMRRAQAKDQPFWLSMHGDAKAGDGSIKRLVKMAYKLSAEGRRWGIIFTNYDALAAHNTEAYLAVGGWDRNMPTYCGDVDMFRRLRLAGYETIDTDIPCEHFGSASIRSDEKTRFLNDITAAYAHDYYRRKWGALTPNETFTVPFNREDLFG